MPNPRLIELLNKHFAGACTPAEKEEFVRLVAAGADNEAVQQGMEDIWRGFTPDQTLAANEAGSLLEAIMYKASLQRPAVRRVHFLKRYRWWAAASVILLLCAGGYVLFEKRVAPPIATIHAATDVKAPVSSKAMVTLANGQRVYLDSIQNGQLAQQGDVKLIKLPNGEIAYQAGPGENTMKAAYNTLFNPRGSRVTTITLADGSKVWLNAGSSLTYPVIFAGKERNVSITGEAYFEVAHKTSMPFKVSKGKLTVQVLGTQFNMNAYDDEPDIKVTLLEGAVKVLAGENGEKTSTLSPGQQLQVNNSGAINIVSNADIDQTIAWKNGKFVFAGNNIQSVMRQLEKWYDIQVEYKGNLSKEEFIGVISRNVNVSEILSMLEETKAIHFQIEGKKIIVK